MLNRKRKPRRLYSAVAALAGAVLLTFELRRIGQTGPEAWFWILVAVLMIVLGTIGMFQRDEDDETRG